MPLTKISVAIDEAFWTGVVEIANIFHVAGVKCGGQSLMRLFMNCSVSCIEHLEGLLQIFSPCLEYAFLL